MILSSALACLHIDWGFIRLNVTSADQFSPHCRAYRDQQLADFEDPAVQRCAADFQAEIPFQNHALPIQGRVIAILADDRLDDDPVTRQALLDNPGGSGAEKTPSSSHDRQARFSRFVTRTKYFAGSTSNWQLSS